MNSTVRLSSSRSRARRLRIWACTEASSAETTSSATTTSGSKASARAIATRWRWPPDSRPGRTSACSGASPTSSSSSSTRAHTCSRGRSLWTRRISASTEPTLRRGFSDVYGLWKITCTPRARVRRGRPWALLTTTPRYHTSPVVGRASPAMQLPSVVLPDPLSPTRPKHSPARSWSEVGRSAGAFGVLGRRRPVSLRGERPYVRLTARTSTSGAASSLTSAATAHRRTGCSDRRRSPPASWS